MADKLKEYLVALGFRIDDASYKKFKSAVATTTKDVAALGAVTVSTATAIAVSVEEVARQYEGLYYASQRTRASVNDLKSYQFGMKQIGIEAGQSQAAIESFATAQRRNPGVKAFVGVSGGVGGTPTDQLLNFVEYQKKLYGDAAYFVAATNAELAGIPEATFLQIWNNLPKLKAAQAEGKRLRKEAGLATDDLTNKSVEFANAWDHLTEVISIGKDRIASDFIDPVGKGVHVIDEVVQAFNRADVASDGFLGKIVGLTAAIGGTTAALAIALRMLGFGGAAAKVGGIAALPAKLVRGGGIPGLALSALVAMKEDSEHGNPIRTWLRAQLGIEDPGEDASWVKSKGFAPWERPPAGQRDPAAVREARIRSLAAALNIDPETALRVAKSEGFFGFKSAIPGEQSFGNFQLHVTPGGRGHAVGDQFRKDTGLDPTDPANEAAMDRYALEWAKKHGWSDFHGAANTGIGSWQGITGTALAPGASSSSSVTFNQTNNNHIVAADARETGDALKGANDRSNADLLRNLKSAIR